MKVKGLVWLFVILFGVSMALAASAPKNKIGMTKAKKIALKTSPGTIKSSELEFEKKQWVYSFDIQGADKQIHEVLVNAQTGKVVSNTVESAANEAAEKNEDAQSSK